MDFIVARPGNWVPLWRWVLAFIAVYETKTNCDGVAVPNQDTCGLFEAFNGAWRDGRSGPTAVDCKFLPSAHCAVSSGQKHRHRGCVIS